MINTPQKMCTPIGKDKLEYTNMETYHTTTQRQVQQSIHQNITLKRMHIQYFKRLQSVKT